MNTEVRELCRVSRGKVRPAGTDRWKDEQLVVPPLPPSNLRGCHLIAIQYDVMVSWSTYRRSTAAIASLELLFHHPLQWPPLVLFSCELPQSPHVVLFCELPQSPPLELLACELLQSPPIELLPCELLQSPSLSAALH